MKARKTTHVPLQWTNEMQESFDALVQKEALGKIDKGELEELERLQLRRDEATFGSHEIERMAEQQEIDPAPMTPAFGFTPHHRCLILLQVASSIVA